MKIIAPFALLIAFLIGCSPAPEKSTIDTLHFVDAEGTAFTQLMNVETQETGITQGKVPEKTGYKLEHPIVDTIYDANTYEILFVDTTAYAMVNAVVVKELKENSIENFVEKTKKICANQGLTIEKITTQGYWPRGFDHVPELLKETTLSNFEDANVVEFVFFITNGTQVFEYPVVFLKDLNTPQKQM